MNRILNFRLLFTIGGIISLAILGSTYLLEYALKLEPCPLCFLQRYALWGVSILFWIGALQNAKGFGRLLYCAGILFFCVLGIIFASRHLWLQYITPDIPSTCLAGFDKLLAFKSFVEILQEIFAASPECSQIEFTFLKLSLPAWSLVGFIGFAAFSIFVGWLQIKRRI